VRQNGVANIHLALKVLGVACTKRKPMVNMVWVHLAAHYFIEFDLTV